MSLRQSFLVIAGALLAVIAAIFYLMTLEAENQHQLAEAEAQHYASYKLVDELRQSSDDLTRMARTYAVTGDPVYEESFRRILAIRNGDVPRPDGYGGIYWDFVTATGEAPEAASGSEGEAVALQDLMRAMNFADDELAKLQEAQQKSDTLVQLEDRAMAAVKGLFADEAGGYTVRDEPDMELARELLHGPEYHRAKGLIMRPIADFMEMVEARTTHEVDTLRAKDQEYDRVGLGLMGLAAGLLVVFFVQLQRRVARPVGELAVAARRAERGDFGTRVSESAKDEIGQLARAFNQMSGAIQADIAARDETAAELAHAREAADSANQAKSAFLANMSHELRTPMNAIIGYSEMLMEDAEDGGNESALSDLKKINSAGKHLLSLINDVLDLSKIEAGKMELFLESFSIPSMVEEVTATVGGLMEKNNNRLTVDVDPTLETMRADVTKVRQSIFNLVGNAAKFTHDGEIRLAVHAESVQGAPWVRISVTDSGIGIPPDKLDHVFTEFSQAEESTTRVYGGTGLGLSITKRFCQMMGGGIGVESTVGKGSTFTIRLPLTVVEPDARAAGEETVAVTPLPDAAEQLILVIDDDPTALDLLGRTLQGEGLRVVTASDGREALRLARTLHPSAITLDVMMPGMDGWEVLEELKADPSTRDIPVIMVTMTDDRAQGYALGATEFLRKPVERSRLVKLLNRYAAKDAERRALVVDDLAENREVLRRALEKEGWKVSEAENGRVALDMVATEAPALILLDLMMPVMDGFEFVMEMGKREPALRIPIVVVTAKDLTDEDRRRLDGGVEGLLERGGLDHDALLEHLRSQLVIAKRPS